MGCCSPAVGPLLEHPGLSPRPVPALGAGSDVSDDFATYRCSQARSAETGKALL
jgi:hypothetical protein